MKGVLSFHFTLISFIILSSSAVFGLIVLNQISEQVNDAEILIIEAEGLRSLLNHALISDMNFSMNYCFSEKINLTINSNLLRIEKNNLIIERELLYKTSNCSVSNTESIIIKNQGGGVLIV